MRDRCQVELDSPSYLTHLMDERRRAQLRTMGANPTKVLDEGDRRR